MKYRIVYTFVLICSLIFSVTAQYENPDGQIHSVIIEKDRIYTENYAKEYSFRNSEQPSEHFDQRGAFTLSIIADFTMAYVWIYNSLGINNFISVDDSIFVTDLPAGTYHVFTGCVPSEAQHTIIILDSVELNSPTQIRISKEDARFSIIYQLVRENFDPLRINTVAFYFFNNILNEGLRIAHRNFDSTAFVFRYNKISDYFKGEWAVKGKQLANQGNLYLLNNEFKDFGKDTVIINDPANFAYADFNYHLPDSVEQNYQIELFTFMPDFHFLGIYDPYYNYPVQQRVYQDTSADLELNTSIFWQGLNAFNILHNFINTAEIRIGQTKVNGFFYGERQAPSFVISENKNVEIGLTPAYWFGKFINENDTIKIRSPYGKWEYLFLSQANDVLRHYPINYRLYRNNILIQDGQFNMLFGPVALRLGFDINDLTIPISPDSYKLVITDNQDEVAGLAGISRVTAEFDLTLSDKNPPNIILFQILSDGELANALDSTKTNKVRFILEDNQQVGLVNLYYTAFNDTLWQEVSLVYIDPYWEAQIPSLLPGYYSLKLVTSDLQSNSITCEMMPAFQMDEVSPIDQHIVKTMPGKFQLFQNYPNPFNPTTTIAYQLPERSRVTLEIYDITGRQVKTLINEVQLAGNYQITWDGADENRIAVSSGVYIYRISVGTGSRQYKSSKKMLLLR